MATRELAEIKDKNGDVNELRDKKLADSIAKNTVVNTDNVRMVDTNGKEVFIARDSFISAIRNVLGGFILSNTKAEAPNIPVFDSNGDFGAITAANLASVLGVGNLDLIAVNRYSTADDFEDGYYYYTASGGGIYVGLDMLEGGILFVKTLNNYLGQTVKLQFYIDFGHRVAWRVLWWNIWHGWNYLG